MIIFLTAGYKGLHAQQPDAPAPLIPQPVKTMRMTGSPFRIRATTTILYKGDSLRPLAGLLDEYQYAYTGHHLSLAPVTEPSSPATPSANTILLTTDSGLIPRSEGYLLKTDRDRTTLTGHDAAGVLYAIQTLRQLWQPSAGVGLRIPPYTILDYPRFSYRGMHLDVGRHFFSTAFIKKYIDLLVLYKFNSFHWHLTEDQGWRIEIKKYPRLQTVAAWRDETLIGHKRDLPHRFDGKRYGGYYTHAEIREIVSYAAARHINVVPEIEMPGHALAALTAYPSLGCTGGPYHTATFWGIFDDVFCAGNDSVFTFLQDVLDEVMDLFPSPYLHIGGDECPKTRWIACPKCQKRMKDLGLKDEHALQSYFIQRVEKYCNTKGRQIIGWDEILEGGLAPGATVMSWRGEEGGLAAAGQQHRVIMSPESHLYFDYYQSLYEDQPLAAGGYTPLDKVYAYEPLATLSADTPGREKALRYIAGIQGQLWTEYMAKPGQVETMILPRAAAVAELAWSPAPAPAGRDYPQFLRRLRQQRKLWRDLHVQYGNTVDEIRASFSTKGNKVRLSLSSTLPGAAIRYTTGHSFPLSGGSLYRRPLLLDSSCVITARLFDGSTATGRRIFRKAFVLHKAIGARITLSQPPVARFDPGAQALVNGTEGSPLYNDGQWMGWNGDGIEIVADLGSVMRIHTIGINFLNYHWQKMWAPALLQFFISEDGTNYRQVYQQRDFPLNGINRVRARMVPENARYLKVVAFSPGVIPSGEYGSGGRPLLMTDEIIID
jgi:hexosaminidase